MVSIKYPQLKQKISKTWKGTKTPKTEWLKSKYVNIEGDRVI